VPGNTVIVNRRGIQMRQSNGRFAPKIVPPAVAQSIGPRTPPGRRQIGPNGVVAVDTPDRTVGQGIYRAQPGPPPGPGYRVVK
jgi:hypothetical protein